MGKSFHHHHMHIISFNIHLYKRNETLIPENYSHLHHNSTFINLHKIYIRLCNYELQIGFMQQKHDLNLEYYVIA